MKEEMGVDKTIDEIKDMVKESFDNLSEDVMDAIHHDKQGNQLAQYSVKDLKNKIADVRANKHDIMENVYENIKDDAEKLSNVV